MAHNQLNTLASDIKNKHNKDWIKWKRIIDKSVVIRVNRLQWIKQERRGLRVTRVTPPKWPLPTHWRISDHFTITSASIRDVVNAVGDAGSTRPGWMPTQVQVQDW